MSFRSMNRLWMPYSTSCSEAMATATRECGQVEVKKALDKIREAQAAKTS